MQIMRILHMIIANISYKHDGYNSKPEYTNHIELSYDCRVSMEDKYEWRNYI